MFPSRLWIVALTTALVLSAPDAQAADQPTKPASIASVVEKLGEAPGEMLGLMAARPKEVSGEGTQYGGGHGAFAYSILQALEGSILFAHKFPFDESALGHVQAMRL